MAEPTNLSQHDLTDACADCFEQNNNLLHSTGKIIPFRPQTMFAGYNMDAWTQLQQEQIAYDLDGPMAFAVPGLIKPLMTQEHLRQTPELNNYYQLDRAMSSSPSAASAIHPSVTSVSTQCVITPVSSSYFVTYNQQDGVARRPAGRLPVKNLCVKFTSDQIQRREPTNENNRSLVAMCAHSLSSMNRHSAISRVDAIRYYLGLDTIDSPSAISAAWSSVAKVYNWQLARNSSFGISTVCNTFLTTAIADSQCQDERYRDLMEIVAEYMASKDNTQNNHSGN